MRTFLWSFSEAERREIKAALAQRSVDLDAQMVGAKFIPGTRWWLPDDPAMQRPLLDALQEMAYFYESWVPPTPLQRAEELKVTRIAVERALTLLRRSPTILDLTCYRDMDEARSHLKKDHELRALMAWKIAEQQEHIDKLKGMGRRSDQSARHRHKDYWHELTRLYDGITGVGPKRRQHLKRFLLACTPARIFPDIIERGFNREISNFFSNLSRRQSRRT